MKPHCSGGREDTRMPSSTLIPFFGGFRFPYKPLSSKKGPHFLSLSYWAAYDSVLAFRPVVVCIACAVLAAEFLDTRTYASEVSFFNLIRMFLYVSVDAQASQVGMVGANNKNRMLQLLALAKWTPATKRRIT